jgi:hypothetical protein
MNITTSNFFIQIRKAGLGIIVLLISVFSRAQIYNITLPGAPVVPNPEYNFTFGTPIGAGASGIHVSTAIATVVWNFKSIPGGATVVGRQMQFRGITVELPADPDAPTPSTGNVTITGTPTVAGSFDFSVTVADAANPGTTHNDGNFTVFVTRPLDVVLVFDRSGSMTLEASPGVSRFNALKNAAGNFANSYQALGGTGHQARIIYFETTPTPVSGCCDAPKIITPAFPTELTTDFIGKDPAGGGTAMGLAIKGAQGKLIPINPAKKPVIFFFTDGEQNPPQILVNGEGYTDNPTGIPGTGSPNNIAIHTVGFEGTGPQSDLLNNLASHTGGTYHHSSTGLDLGDEFTDALNSMLNGSSPQLVARSSHTIPANGSYVDLEKFPLNNQVNKLLLTFEFGKVLDRKQIYQVLKKIMVKRNNYDMLGYSTSSFVGNSTNTILLTLDFVDPPNERSPINPAGQWTVSISDSTLQLNTVKLTVVADDHRLHLDRALSNPTPKVKENFPISFKLDWLTHPIKNATVEAIVLRPGQDLGNALAINPLKVDVSKAPDAGTPGRQKFDKLFATDSSFKAIFNKSENVVPLTHTSDGKYESTFNGLTVSGTYKLLIRIKGTDSAAGEIQRILSESFFTSFNGVDLPGSKITTVIKDSQLVMNITPITPDSMLVGPGFGNTIGVTNGIKVDSVDDHQDGSYTITFSGAINDTTSLSIGGQVISTGKKLQDVGNAKMRIPVIIWILLGLLLILILWLIFRKKK